MGSKKGKTAKAKSDAKKNSSKKSTKKSTKEAQKKEFTPREHRLVPSHEVMSEEEVDTLFEKYDIDPTNLPVILASDAALKGLNAQLGDVIKIKRASPTAGSTVFYRRVAYE